MTNKKIRLSLIIGKGLRKQINDCKKQHLLNVSEVCREALKREIKKLEKRYPII